jgi:perosamine synthetase
VLFEHAVPVFVDIDPVSFNLNPDLIEQRITDRTKAILPVHVFGRPADMDAVLNVAHDYGLRVVEDACEALGARWRGVPVGALGDVGTFAFYPNKQMTTGEGGMIVTNDAELDRAFKSFRNQGRGEAGGWLQHERLGFNYRLSDINCALGLSQLGRIDDILDERREVAEEYRRQLAEIDELELPVYDVAGAEISWFVYVVRLKGCSLAGRDEVLRRLRAEGIACSNYFSPIHLQSHFRRLGHREGEFPVTEAVATSTIALPFYNKLKATQIRRIGLALRQALSHGPQAAYSLHRSVL